MYRYIYGINVPVYALSHGYIAPLYPFCLANFFAESSVLILDFIKVLPKSECRTCIGGYIHVSWSQNT